MASTGVTLTCGDFMQFQDALKTLRTIDDKIIYALNTTVPTDSFAGKIDAKETCQKLYEDLMNSYDSREIAIKKCITEVSSSVNQYRDVKTKDPNNLDLLKKLRNEQHKLRMMQSELNIEEVVKDRSLKVFYERCRNHYRPPPKGTS
ncbi:protein MIX23-like [Saccoglossus kowalevskii]|uniref:Protein MIX23 n=1 Tax=Saccoglossus kowalevskii TaxID=10224 RepID=A0ABM0MS87_SACKO|nr:PREDICTED: coiled-coil domain-containing protein 58-like [Saccoglossus kowalevskii]